MSSSEVAERFRSLLRRPVVVAPMAGGPSNPNLVVAAAEAHALGFLAAGYKTVDAMEREIQEVRARTDAPFGVNVFVPGDETASEEQLQRYVDALAVEAAALGVELGEARWDDDRYQPKIDALLAAAPPLVSFTFGCPSAEIVAAFHRVSTLVLVTVTSPAEAGIAAAAGADALCVQGPEAGGHRGTFTNAPPRVAEPGLVRLVADVAATTELPLLAAGGLMTAEQIRAVQHVGAVAAQCGTAFLCATEGGTGALQRAAITEGRYTDTAVTRAFSGRPARGLLNGFMSRHTDAPAAYPEINSLTQPLRAAAVAAGDTERTNLWAGTGFRQVLARTTGEILDHLTGA